MNSGERIQSTEVIPALGLAVPGCPGIPKDLARPRNGAVGVQQRVRAVP